MPSGITRHILGNRSIGGTIVIPNEGELLSTGNKISVSPGACVTEGFLDGAMDIQKGIVTITAPATIVFHLGHILRTNWYGSLIRIDRITLFFTANGTADFTNLGFGYNDLNPAMGISHTICSTIPTIYSAGDDPAVMEVEDNNYTPPRDVIIGKIDDFYTSEAREYAIIFDVNTAGAAPNDLVIHGIEIEYSLVTGE